MDIMVYSDVYSVHAGVYYDAYSVHAGVYYDAYSAEQSENCGPEHFTQR